MNVNCGACKMDELNLQSWTKLFSISSLSSVIPNAPRSSIISSSSNIIKLCSINVAINFYSLQVYKRNTSLQVQKTEISIRKFISDDSQNISMFSLIVIFCNSFFKLKWGHDVFLCSRSPHKITFNTIPNVTDHNFLL